MIGYKLKCKSLLKTIVEGDVKKDILEEED